MLIYESIISHKVKDNSQTQRGYVTKKKKKPQKGMHEYRCEGETGETLLVDTGGLWMLFWTETRGISCGRIKGKNTA